MTDIQFEAFPKIRRYQKSNVTVTEKIDGTNAALVFDDDGLVFCQSRNRVITPGKESDNAGFADWAWDNEDDLFEFFGPGRHFGEWFGCGIQRGYGMADKWFAPFNTHIFHDDRAYPANVCPTPVLARVTLDRSPGLIAAIAADLAADGSRLDPAYGFDNPEGLMIYGDTFGYLKMPFDSLHKWESA